MPELVAVSSQPAVSPHLSVVIPVFNEAENIAPLVSELDAVMPLLPRGSEVILVDDGSRDGSWTAIQSAAVNRPWLKALRFLGNQGQTAAMAAGIMAARGEYVGFMDADLQNDPNDLPRLLKPLLAGEADVACGWRAKRMDRAITRKLPSWIANRLLTRALGLQLHDLGCTLKIFRRVYLQNVGLYGEMHRFIAAYAAAQGARIVEMVANHRHRRHGTTHYGLSRSYKVLIDLLTVQVLNTYGSKPAYFFGKIGLLFGWLGTMSFGVVLYRTFWLGRPQSTPMIFIMLLMYVSGLICIMTGLLAEINIRILHQVGGRQPYCIVDKVGEVTLNAQSQP